MDNILNALNESMENLEKSKVEVEPEEVSEELQSDLNELDTMEKDIATKIQDNNNNITDTCIKLNEQFNTFNK